MISSANLTAASGLTLLSNYTARQSSNGASQSSSSSSSTTTSSSMLFSLFYSGAKQTLNTAPAAAQAASQAQAAGASQTEPTIVVSGAYAATFTSSDGSTAVSATATEHISESTATPSSTSLTVAAQVSDGQVTGTVEGDITANADLYSAYQNFIAENSLTSQQLSDEAYSGAALPSGGGSSQTFLQAIKSMYTTDADITSMAKQMIAWVGQGRPATSSFNTPSNAGMTDAQIIAQADAVIANATNGNNVADAITAAYHNHTLTIQNADQVQGLDFEDSYTASGSGQGSSSAGGGTFNFNTDEVTTDFLNNNPQGNSPDGQQSALLSFGETYAYLTW